MTDEAREPHVIERRDVRVKPMKYQPSKAELEEPIDIRRADGSRPTIDEMVQAVLAPVNVIEDPNA